MLSAMLSASGDESRWLIAVSTSFLIGRYRGSKETSTRASVPFVPGGCSMINGPPARHRAEEEGGGELVVAEEDLAGGVDVMLAKGVELLEVETKEGEAGPSGGELGTVSHVELDARGTLSSRANIVAGRF